MAKVYLGLVAANKYMHYSCSNEELLETIRKGKQRRNRIE